ncbi:hypothetical protein C9F10_23470 [Salmonella enterica subsp. enterica serovar Poona]|uniref:Uncharacterized protein n=1 Tax=Salmonella enterica subsp. enterica serovar Poona TaxID=436295 RepID=A0A659S0R8_SALET|nr:hypothetical protein C9F10_23470 [Salmonella enterica subsp. enterica serovar Poona]
MLRHNPLRAVWKQMLALFFINSSSGAGKPLEWARADSKPFESKTVLRAVLRRSLIQITEPTSRRYLA